MSLKAQKRPMEKPASRGFIPCFFLHTSCSLSPVSSIGSVIKSLIFSMVVIVFAKYDLQIQLMDAKTVLGDNDIDDVRWLCSLTEAELDLLMGLKNMVNMRAKKIGHETLAKKFDLRMLRAFSFIFMEHLKGQLKDVPVAAGFYSNLLKKDLNGSFASMTIEDLYPYICSDRSKRISDMFFQDMPPSQKQKTSQ